MKQHHAFLSPLISLAALLASFAAYGQPAAPCAPCDAHAKSETSQQIKRKLTESVDDKGALTGLNAVVRYGGLWPAEASVGAHWYMRQYVHLFRYIGFGMDAYFLKPTYTAALYGYPITGFDLTAVGRACFTAGVVDLCGGVGLSDAMIQVNVGPVVHTAGTFGSFQPSMNLAILPNVVVNLNVDIGWYFQTTNLVIDGLKDQRFEPNRYFMTFGLGLAYRVQTRDFSR